MMKEKGEIIPVVKEEEQRQQQQQQQQLLPKSSSSSSSSSSISSSKEERKSSLSCMQSTAADDIVTKTKQEDIVTKTKQEDKIRKEEEVEKDVISCDEMGPRERLKRHRREVAGHVWIPDMWGQESFLNDWIDCSSFDASLIRHNIMVARSSLIQEPHIIAPP